jgi:hypothetical protein
MTDPDAPVCFPRALLAGLVLADFDLAGFGPVRSASQVCSAGQMTDPDAPVCFPRALLAGLVLADFDLADFGPVRSASQVYSVGQMVDLVPASSGQAEPVSQARQVCLATTERRPDHCGDD